MQFLNTRISQRVFVQIQTEEWIHLYSVSQSIVLVFIEGIPTVTTMIYIKQESVKFSTLAKTVVLVEEASKE